MTRVKICGNTNINDVQLGIELGADYLGFIFAPNSRRTVTLADAQSILLRFPQFKNFVGVFCNQPKKEVENIAKQLDLKFLQFHGEETALYCNSFMEKGFQVIKTFHVKDAMSLKRLDEYNVSAFLFDTFSQSEKGGTGVPFDWNIIEDRPYVHERLFLAGGLNIHNVCQAVERVRPFAVDVASGVESQPGVKDPLLLREFIDKVKKVAFHDDRKS